MKLWLHIDHCGTHFWIQLVISCKSIAMWLMWSWCGCSGGSSLFFSFAHILSQPQLTAIAASPSGAAAIFKLLQENSRPGYREAPVSWEKLFQALHGYLATLKADPGKGRRNQPFFSTECLPSPQNYTMIILILRICWQLSWIYYALWPWTIWLRAKPFVKSQNGMLYVLLSNCSTTVCPPSMGQDN